MQQEPPRVTGVFRASDNNRLLCVSLTTPPTDDDLRSFHDYARKWKPRAAATSQQEQRPDK